MRFLRVVGRSGSGKTRLIEGVVSELVSRGYRVSVVKHSVHGSSFDEPGKDTWRFLRAGAQSVALFSDHEVVTIRALKEEPSLDAVLELLNRSSDMVIVEGYRKGKGPAIEVLGANDEHERIDGLMAVVCEVPRDLEVPLFRFEEVAKVADFIEATFLRSARKSGCQQLG